MASTINGFSVGYTIAGAIILWSGITSPTGSIPDTLKSILTGTAPGVTETTPSQTGSSNPADAASGEFAIPAASAGTSEAANNQAIAQKLAAAYGWSSGQQWDALVALWNRESGWNNTAQNPTSTAYGIAQFLDTTWATVGATKTSNPTLQIVAGLAYIKMRYGNPVAAWNHEEQIGWY